MLQAYAPPFLYSHGNLDLTGNTGQDFLLLFLQQLPFWLQISWSNGLYKDFLKSHLKEKGQEFICTMFASINICIIRCNFAVSTQTSQLSLACFHSSKCHLRSQRTLERPQCRESGDALNPPSGSVANPCGTRTAMAGVGGMVCVGSLGQSTPNLQPCDHHLYQE